MNLMKLSDLFHTTTIELNLPTDTKVDTLEFMADLFQKDGGLSETEPFVEALLAREAQSTTGIGEEIAMPHAQDPSIQEARIIFGRSTNGIDWDSFDGQPAKLIFMIAAPEGGSDAHLKALSQLSSLLMNPEAKEAFQKASTNEEIIQIVQKYEEKPDEAEVEAQDHPVENDAYLLAVTACPTGIAHTYMAEEKLKQAGKDAGVKIKVETNGQSGVGNRLTQADIEAADAIIVAADRKVDMNRFDGKRVITVPVADGINKADQLIEQALEGQGRIYQADQTSEETEDSGESESLWRQVYKHLMNGVSTMLPFVVAGGLLIAISFFWGIHSADPSHESYHPIAQTLKTLGDLSFAMMLPVLAGFIGRSIADTPGLVVGMMGGVFANPSVLAAFSGQGVFEDMPSSGFLGAMLAGFLAGGIIWLLKKAFAWLPKSLEGMKPILIYPVLGVLLMGLLMFFVINRPLGALTTGLISLLNSIPREWGVVLGFIAGAMMSIDMGGPINKAAYVTGTALVTEAQGAGSDVMAAVMVGGMVPPLAIALSATMNKNLWNENQRNSAMVNYVMGAAFITEGAIPFAAANPVRVIPSLAVGAGVAGALSMFFGCVSYVPHGGVFAVLANGVTNKWLYLLSWIIGGLVGAILLNISLRNQNTRAQEATG